MVAGTTTIDPAAIILALATLVTALGTSIATLYVAIRNGQRTAAVHDCLHRQGEDVRAIIQTQADVKTALAVAEDDPASSSAGT